MKIVRIALDISVTKANVGSTAWDLQWSLGKVVKAEGTTPKQVFYYKRDESGKKTFIRYIEDNLIDLPYIEVYGENPSFISKVVEQIHKKLPTHSVPEIVEMVNNAKDREELFLAIRYLGIGCGGYPMTPSLLELFKKLAQAPDPDIRLVTELAMTYTAAAEFQSILENMAQNDPKPEIREQAAHTLEGLKKYIINQSVS